MNAAATEIVLDAAEVRVLGSLVEKEITTPDYYPLSLNALVNACNQSSNRDPVVVYGEPTVIGALESLREKKLAFLFEGVANRVAKYGHKFSETLGLSRPETAVLCVLLLRGPQTVGELRGRTGRLHEFSSLPEVESTLQGLAARSPQPLVAKLPRQAGFKESRYTHLLADRPEVGPSETMPAPASPLSVDPLEGDQLARLEQEVATLRRELAEMKAKFDELKRQLE